VFEVSYKNVLYKSTVIIIIQRGIIAVEGALTKFGRWHCWWRQV